MPQKWKKIQNITFRLNLILCLTALSLFAFGMKSARAGSYSVSYSANGIFSSGVTNSGEFWGFYALIGSNIPSGTISENPTITTTFAWTPASGQTASTDPPPTQVIVEQTCSPNCYTSSGNDNLPVVTLNDTFGPSESGASVSIIDTGYTVVSNPGQSFTVTCSPSYNVVPGSAFRIFMSVEYTATASPLVISTTGDVVDSSGSSDILIGQRLHSELLAGGLTQSNWQWGISGGTPIYYFDATTGFAPTFWNAANETNSGTTCYFTVGDTAGATQATIQCTADLAVPTGCYPTAGFKGVTVTKNEDVWSPTFNPSVKIGLVEDYLADPPTSGFVELQSYYDAYNTGEAQGIHWDGTSVKTSTPFLGEGYGSWSIFQIYTPYVQYYYNGANYLIAGYQNNANDESGTEVSVYGLMGSDAGVPYGGLTYSADGVADGNSDSPSITLSTGSDLTEDDYEGNFYDTLMYMPPVAAGSGAISIWVPLSYFSWVFEVDAIRDLTNDYWSTSNEMATLTPPSPTSSYSTWNYFVPSPCIFLVSPPSTN